MADKPYTARTGGRYIRDPETGKVTRADDARQPAQRPAPARGEPKGNRKDD